MSTLAPVCSVGKPGRGARQPDVRRLLLALIFVALWEVAARLIANPVKLPAPSLVVMTALPMAASGELFGHIIISLQRVALGFGAAMVLGITLGVLLGASRRAARLMYPLLEMLRPVPALAMMPIFMALFGIGEPLSVSIVFFAAFFPIVVNAQAGVREVPRIYEEAAATLGAGAWQTIWEVMLPASLPSIFTGIRLGLQFGWMSVVGAEFVGATTGLGFMILYYMKFVATEKVIVGMALIGLLGFLLDRLVLAVRRLLLPWQTD